MEEIKYIGFGGAPTAPPQYIPVEEPEGIVSGKRGVNTVYTVSLSKIQVLDLISEGEIKGLASGSYNFSGTLGATGWDSYSFSQFPNPPAPHADKPQLRSIHWNEVPLVNSKNLFNFQNIDVKIVNGTPNGAQIGALDAQLTISRNISERLRYGQDFTKYYRILNKDCVGCRVNVKFGALSKIDTSTPTYGNVTGAQVDYSIYYKPIFSSSSLDQTKYTLGKKVQTFGKISYGYIRSTPITFNTTDAAFKDRQGFIGWEVGIRRDTPDSISSAERNQTYVDSLTEIYGNTYSYPNSAIISQTFSAEFFSQIPSRAFLMDLVKIKVPNNYNPIQKTYGEARGGPTGTTTNWNGQFSDTKQWTDNPAWCYYDLITNNRYGLGKYIPEAAVDKWTLYDIACYCDVLVPDGNGGLEPRFTCNLLISSRDEAYQTINNMASIFRAMAYYSAGGIYTVQDSPKRTYFYQFTNANVENGDFTYSSSSKRVRHTVAIVRYNDKYNFYKPAIEYVEDLEGIKRYGIRELEITAYGCTSRGQALRWGRWALLTETLETETVSFVAGHEGHNILPGDVFQIYDSNRKVNRFGGRTLYINNNATGALVQLDDYVSGFNNATTYTLSLLTPTYNYDNSIVSGFSSDDIPNIRRPQVQKINFLGSQTTTISGKTEVALTNPLDTGSYVCSGNIVWMIEASGDGIDAQISSNQYDYFRAIRINEKEDNKYEISAVQYAGDKYNQIESGINFIAVTGSIPPAAPSTISLSSKNYTANVKGIYYSYNVLNYDRVANFNVYGKSGAFVDSSLPSQDYLIDVNSKEVTTGLYLPPSNGTYYFRAYTVDKFGNTSTSYAESSIIIANTNPVKDLIISSLRLTVDPNINSATQKTYSSYSGESPTFTWQVGSNQQDSVTSGVSFRVSAREPSQGNVPSKNIYFSQTGIAPTVDNSYRYTFDIGDNIASVASISNKRGPFRSYDFVVEAIDTSNNSSAGGNVTTVDALYNNPTGYDIIYVNNPRISGINLTTGTLGVSGYSTDQWINSDGNIIISLTSGTFPADTAGSVVYWSNKTFTKNQAIGLGVPLSTIYKQVNAAASTASISVPAHLTGVNEIYIGLSLFDSFDKAVYDRGTDITTGIYISDIIKINKRGGQTNAPFVFKNWLEITLDYRNQNLSSWGDTSAGISGIVLQSYNYVTPGITPAPPAQVRFNHRIYFTTVLNSSGYTVLGTQPATKFSDGYLLSGQTGRHFFGVLNNSN